MFIRARIKRERLENFHSPLFLNDTLCLISVYDSTNHQDLVRHPILIGDVDSSSYVQSTAGGFPVPGDISLDFRVYWTGKVGMSLDYLAIDNKYTDSLFRYNTMNDFFNCISGLSESRNNTLSPGIFALRVEDEIDNNIEDSARYPVFGVVEELTKKYLSTNYAPFASGLTTYCYPVSYHSGTSYGDRWRRFLHETDYPYLLTDSYPFHRRESTTDTTALISTINDMVGNFRKVADAANKEKKRWFSLAQISNYNPDDNCDSSSWLREPTVREISVQAHIMAAMGAKGVGYYQTSSVELPSPVACNTPEQRQLWGFLLPDGTMRRNDTYGEDKCDSVQRLNRKLEKYGPTLMRLEWKNSVNEGEYLNSLTLDDSIVVTNVETRHGSPEVADTVSYYHIGWLKDQYTHVDYLYLVNKRTQADGARKIALHFNAGHATKSILIESADSTNATVIPRNGTFAVHVPPGDGVLYRVREATWSGNEPLDTLTTVVSGASLHITEGTRVTLGFGHKLRIEHGASVVCDSGSVLDLIGGTIEMEGYANLVIHDPNTLQGSGNIINPTLAFQHGWNIQSGQTIELHGGGRLFYVCDSNHANQQLVSGGNLFFSHSAEPYRFGMCLHSILLHD